MIGTMILLSFLSTHGALAGAQPKAAPVYSRVTIDEALQRDAEVMQKCYDAHRPAVRPHVGRLRLRFALAGDGRVESTMVEHDGLHAPRATACIQRAATAFRFPPPGEAHALLSYTFLFR